jgi:hypothetical protein
LRLNQSRRRDCGTNHCTDSTAIFWASVTKGRRVAS